MNHFESSAYTGLAPGEPALLYCGGKPCDHRGRPLTAAGLQREYRRARIRDGLPPEKSLKRKARRVVKKKARR